jgi:hypothetical protein
MEKFILLFAMEDSETYLDLLRYLKRRKISKPGGSADGKQPNIDRQFDIVYQKLQHDYFIERPLFSDILFRRRFRMSRRLFERIMNKLRDESYFMRKPDATGKFHLED